jgi:predicted DNA-binding transcriptional regulator YafY
MLPWLVSNPNLKPAEIAKHFNISIKQLFEDLALLTFTGPGEFGGDLVDIQYDENGISVIDHQGLNRSIQFTQSQRNLLTLGLTVLMEFLPAGEQLKAGYLIKKLRSNLLTVVADSNSEEIYTDALDVVYKCISGEMTLNFEYHGVSDTSPRFRSVSPTNIKFLNGDYYIEGHCHDSRGVRTFKLSRITNISMSNFNGNTYAMNVEEARENSNYVITCKVLKSRIDVVSHLPEFQILANDDDQYVCTFVAYHHDFIIKLGLMYRDVMKIIAPENIEDVIEKSINRFLESN